MNIDYHLIGKRIKTYRKALKKTQEDLAEHLSVSVGYISQIERGVTKVSLDTLSKIAVFLNCDIPILLNDTAPNQCTYLNKELIAQFNQLDTAQKNIVMDIISALLKYQ